jgi:hypothetical protein
MVKTAANPGGTPIDAFDAIRAGRTIGSGYSSPSNGPVGFARALAVEERTGL